jgi:hypothetical protein
LLVIVGLAMVGDGQRVPTRGALKLASSGSR